MDTMDGAVVSACRAQVRWVVDAGPPDVSVVRSAARATVHNWRVGVLADDIALIVGELAANAWIYGQPPVVVMLRLEDSSILVEVSDAGPGIVEFSKPEPLGVHGRGLPVVASLADELGLCADHTGKTIWARLHFHWAVPPEEDEAAALDASRAQVPHTISDGTASAPVTLSPVAPGR